MSQPAKSLLRGKVLQIDSKLFLLSLLHTISELFEDDFKARSLKLPYPVSIAATTASPSHGMLYRADTIA